MDAVQRDAQSGGVGREEHVEGWNGKMAHE